MELSQDYALTRLFERLSALNPKSFEEFNKTSGAAAEELFKLLGVTGAEYSISVPARLPFSEQIPKGGVIFGKVIEKAEPVCLRRTFDNGGRITFNFYFDEGKKFSPEEHSALNSVFGWFFHIICELINSATYKMLVLVDGETGVPLLPSLMRFMEKLMATGTAKNYTAVYFNIRNFKSIHRYLTFLEGNEILARYCQTVSDALGKNEILARLGGDSFVAVILDEHRDYFFDLIQNIIIKYTKDGRRLTFVFGATMGVSKIADGENPDEVMIHISSSYQAAREKRSIMSYYDKKTSLDIMERKVILSSFSKALADKEFFVVYQPKVRIKGRRLVGAEALVRWKHDDKFIMPGSFIPTLENDGCICELDFYMLEQTCRFIRKLYDENYDPVRISVNFSKRHLTNNKLVEEIADVIDKYNIPHNMIEVELTESEDSHNQNVMKEIVDDMSALGIQTSIDDFGTGYSSLEMLRTLNLNELKIDRSFIPVDTSNENDKGRLMLQGVINLAKSLGLTLVAEGVETPEQLALIEEMGCDVVQGYIFDKPLMESEFIERIVRKTYLSE